MRGLLRGYKAGIVLLTVSMMLGGCGFKDLDKRFFVTAVGIDTVPGSSSKVRVTLKLGIPRAKIEPGEIKFELLSDDSESVSEALRHLKAKMDKEMDFGHAKMILIQKDLAQDRIREVMDWAFRRRDVMRIAYLALTEGTAEDLLRLNPPSERVPGNSLFLSFGGEGSESPYTITAYLFDFYRRLHEQGLDPFLPVIKQNTKTTYTIDQVALFNKEGQRLMLNPQETRTLLILLRRGLSNFLIRVNEAEEPFSLAGTHSKVKYAFQNGPDGQPRLQVRLQVTGIVEESKSVLLPSQLDSLNGAVSQTVSSHVLKLLTKLQKNQVDPLGFGLMYRASKHSPKEWEDWQSLYPGLQFDVQATAHVEGTGLVE